MAKRGEKHNLAKLSDYDVWLAREVHKSGIRIKEVAEKFETNYTTMRDILNGKNRQYTPDFSNG